MKRSWIGLGILLMLLAVGILTSVMMDRIHTPIAWELEQAADSAEVGLWEGAGALARQAEGHWMQWDHFRSSLADHSPVEEIEALFVQLPIYEKEQDAHFIAICRELARKISAMGEAHGLAWWNIL